jgi:metal-sulfur cluster biosynthetic enzyme
MHAAEPTSESVQALLTRIVDPCSIATGAPIDLVSMGLIERISVVGGRVEVELALTSPVCWSAGLIVEEIRSVLLAEPGIREVEVRVDPYADWTPDRISAQAQDRLARLRPRTRVGRSPSPTDARN